MRTLWDLLAEDRQSPQATASLGPNHTPPRPTEKRLTAAERYDRMSRTMLGRYGIRVRKWRSGTSGVAWQVTYKTGEVSRLIESPRPRGPVSASIFLHEVGHHAIGFDTYKPRCLEEFHAWRFAREQMESWGIDVTDRVEHRIHASLRYAVDKALRRGLKKLPVELTPYLPDASSAGYRLVTEPAAESRRSALRA